MMALFFSSKHSPSVPVSDNNTTITHKQLLSALFPMDISQLLLYITSMSSSWRCGPHRHASPRHLSTHLWLVDAHAALQKVTLSQLLNAAGVDAQGAHHGCQTHETLLLHLLSLLDARPTQAWRVNPTNMKPMYRSVETAAFLSLKNTS